MRKIIFIGLILSGQAAAQQSVGDKEIALRRPDALWRPYVQMQSWAAYDAMPLRDFSGKWENNYSPKPGINHFLQRHRAGFGVEKDGWTVGVEYRLEASLAADRDTLDLYRMYKQKVRPALARDFNVDARLKAWSAGGMRVGRTFALGDSAVKGPLLMLSGALYGTLRNRELDAGGTVRYTPDDAYGFDARYQDTNTRYRYMFMEEQPQHSSGTSVSMALQWPLSEQLTANLALNDIWSRLRWSNLPSVYKSINSQVSSTDQDGYVNYQPLLSGKNSLIDQRASIGSSAALSLSYQLAQWDLRMRLDRIEGVTIPAASAGYRTAWGIFAGSYETRFNTVGLAYTKGPFRLQLRSNRWPLSEASAAALDVGLQLGF
ncbi:hypothetical protein HSX11_14475 [Oxalobacteraceae bacterium]|nr:hypothetical protein [Oxalobacteraceae bacterium]